MRLFDWLALALLLAGVPVPSAEAQQFGGSCLPRPLSITDPYGTPFHSWYGSPVAFNSYVNPSFNGGINSGNVGVTNGYFGGGVPAVASATTPEWVVQRTSVFPIASYIPWAVSQRAIVAPWISRTDKKQMSLESQPRPLTTFRTEAQRDGGRTREEILKAAEPRFVQLEGIPPTPNDTMIRQVSIAWSASDERDQNDHAEGDRLFRDGQYGEAYRCYFNAQREVGDRCEVYFRQAYALVAMGRFSHAVAKLKRGLQVDPNYPRHGATLDEIFGVDDSTRKAEFLEQVACWTNSNCRDPDRLFLLGVILYFDEDPRSLALFRSAWTLAGRGQHLRAFLEKSTLLMIEPANAPNERVVEQSR